MDLGTLRGIGTVVLMASFVVLCAWAYSPKRREQFREAARLALLDDESGDER